MFRKSAPATVIGQLLISSNRAKTAELVAVFIPAVAILLIAGPLVGENPLARGALVSAAYVAMLAGVWMGLRLRGQTWEHIGLRFRPADARTVVRTVLLSVVVCIAAVAAYAAGAVVMVNTVGIPDGADMSGYDHLRGNLPMLIVSLATVYITASFGEEVIYRGFLITRIAELASGGKAAWWMAAVFSSLVFGLVHYEWGMFGMVQATLMGLALAASWLLVRRNLWVTILAHGYMDTILLLQMYFADSVDSSA